MSRVDDATTHEISKADEGPTARAAPFLKGADSATAWIAADLQRATFMSTPAFKVSDAPVTLARLLQIGRRFQEMRSLHGLSLSETAVRLGMPATRLSLIEAGERRPFLQELAQASREFAISTDYLLGLSENDDPGATTVERIAVLRHIEHLMSQQADRIVSAAREELRDGAAHAAYTRDVAFAHLIARSAVQLPGPRKPDLGIPAVADRRFTLRSSQAPLPEHCSAGGDTQVQPILIAVLARRGLSAQGAKLQFRQSHEYPHVDCRWG
jgi:transcriptional regulator with XRE-family HTH domain